MRKHLGFILFVVALFGFVTAMFCTDPSYGRDRRRLRIQRAHRPEQVFSATTTPDASSPDVSDAFVADIGDASDAFVADVSDAFVADVSDASVADVSDATIADADTNLNAFTPDGVNDSIIVADSARFDGVLNHFTICAWIKEATYAVNDEIMVKNTSTQREWNFRVHSATAGALQLCVQSALANTACPADCHESAASLTNGTAAFVCAVYDGTQAASADRVTLYSNATVNAETCVGTIPTAFVDGTSQVEVAQFGAANQFGAGSMDEITYWSTSLTAGNINDLCCGNAGGCGGVCGYGRSNTHGISGLQLYLDIDGDLVSYVTATDEAGGDDNGVYTLCLTAASCIGTPIP